MLRTSTKNLLRFSLTKKAPRKSLKEFNPAKNQRDYQFLIYGIAGITLVGATGYYLTQEKRNQNEIKFRQAEIEAQKLLRQDAAMLQQDEAKMDEMLDKIIGETNQKRMVAAFADSENQEQSGTEAVPVAPETESNSEDPAGKNSEPVPILEAKPKDEAEVVAAENQEANGKNSNQNPFPTPESENPDDKEAELKNILEAEKKSAEDIKNQLDENIMETAAAVKLAIQLQQLAEKAISDHTKLVRVAMDDINYNHEERANNWAAAAQGLEIRESARKATADPTREAKAKLLKFREFVNHLVEKYPELSEEIFRAEDWFSEMKRDMDNSIMNTASRLTEAEVMSNYSKRMQEMRDEFHKELFAEETLPDDIAKIKGVEGSEILGDLGQLLG